MGHLRLLRKTLVKPFPLLCQILILIQFMAIWNMVTKFLGDLFLDFSSLIKLERHVSCRHPNFTCFNTHWYIYNNTKIISLKHDFWTSFNTFGVLWKFLFLEEVCMLQICFGVSPFISHMFSNMFCGGVSIPSNHDYS